MRLPKYGYLVSNRSASSPDDTIGPVTTQRALTHADRPYVREGYAPVSESDWTSTLVADLSARYQGSSDPWDLFLYVHGYATSEVYGRIGLESLGLALTSVGLDRAMMVGVSWPSDLTDYYSAQDNAIISGALVIAVGKIVTKVRSLAQRTVRVTVFAHSMGNYLLSNCLAGGSKLPAIDAMFMLAADVDYDLWVPGSAAYPQGNALAAAFSKIYVFYTSNDSVLWYSEGLNLKGRLGYWGASSVQPVPANVAQFDYSAQGNTGYCSAYVPTSYDTVGEWTGSLVHSSSKFVPDLLSFYQAIVRTPAPGRLDLAPTRDLAKLKRALRATKAAKATAKRRPRSLPAK